MSEIIIAVQKSMKIAVFSTKSYERTHLEQANAQFGYEVVFLEPRLNAETAVLARGFQAVCAFVNDDLNAEVPTVLSQNGTRLIALRCIQQRGFGHGQAARCYRCSGTAYHAPIRLPLARL